MQHRARAVLIAAGISVLINGLFVLVEWLGLRSSGDEGWPLAVAPIVLVLLLVAVAAVALLSLLAALIPRLRRTAALIALICVVHVVTGIACIRIAGSVRHAAFERLAVRSAPLVASIRRYTAEQGHPPATLQQLVPAYLERVPGTGLAAYPDYEYVTGDDARERYHGNDWVLWVSTPSGIIDFDLFVYYPRGNYPAAGHGGVLERIGEWAYVHE